MTSALDGDEWSASRLNRFTPRKIHFRYPLDRKLGGPQSRSGHGVEDKHSQPPPGIEPRSSDRPARSQSLHRLIYIPQGKNPRFPFDRRLGGPESRSERGGEEKKSRRSACSLITILTELHQLRLNVTTNALNKRIKLMTRLKLLPKVQFFLPKLTVGYLVQTMWSLPSVPRVQFTFSLRVIYEKRRPNLWEEKCPAQSTHSGWHMPQQTVGLFPGLK
jgi:hypothetical protein